MALLDTSQLVAVHELAGDLLGEMLQSFATSTRRGLDRLAAEWAAEWGQTPWEEGAERAHQWKGAAANLGLARFAVEAGRLEELLRAASPPPVERLGELRMLLDDSVRAAEGFLAAEA